MSRPMRGLIVTMGAMLVAGFILPVGMAALLWYLPVPRRWWSLTILVLATFLLSAATGIVGMLRVRRSRREIEAEQVNRSRADHGT